MTTATQDDRHVPTIKPDAINQATEILRRFAGGERLTMVGDRKSDGVFVLASVGIAVAEQLRRLADTLEVRHD